MVKPEAQVDLFDKMFTLPHVIFPLVLLVLYATIHTQATFDANLICTLIANGTTIKDPRTCNTSIQCVDGAPVTTTCDDNLFYDRESETCVSADTLNCISSNPCAATAGTDGFVADPYTCDGYYYCSNGNAAHGTCSVGLNFNPGTQDCIRNFPCVVKMDPDSYCNIVPDGVFIKETDSCTDYQMCWKGQIINGSCTNAFYFNAVKGLCDYQKDVECVEETVTLPNRPLASDVCAAAGDFVSDELTCNGYYLCRESATDDGGLELQHGVCPVGRFFNPANGGSCIDRTQIVCPYSRCAGMGLAYVQLANASDDDCEGYLICQDGVAIATGVCPAGEYFNEVTQRCTTQAISYPACALSAKSTVMATTATTEATAA